MLPDLQLAVRLQEIDNRATELSREISELPKHIALIEKKLESQQRKIEAGRAALSANQKDRKKMEVEIQTQEQKTSKLRGQMTDAKTNEQYRAFQNEIEFCENEVRKAEDRILELMGESEPLDKNLKSAEVALGEERAQAEVEKREAMARTAQDKQALAEIQQERGQLVPRMNANLYGRYETVRRTRRGIAVAEALDGRCSACHMAMRLQFFQDLKKDDQVMSCESCGRMLYYNPPAAVEDLAGESAPAIRG